MISKEAYIVIDIGTGNVRVAVTDVTGEILGIDRENIIYHKDINYPEALYFDTQQLWEQVSHLTKNALSQAGDVLIKALTATSQREGIVLLDKNGNSQIGLPNIDHRGREWEDMIRDKSHVYQLTGRYPTSLFSAMKIVGIRERRKDIWEDFSTFLSISDWIEYMLSGVVHYEHSQASETLLYDVEGKSWSTDLCGVFNINPSVLPPLTDSGTILGTITNEQAVNLRVSADAQIIVGGGDTQLAIMSTCPETNDVVIVSGTTTPIIKLTSQYVTDEKERTWTGRHTNENSFMFEANAGVTGLNYQRLKEIFYPNESYDVIEQELTEVNSFQCIASLGSLLADEKAPLTKGGFIFDAPVSHQLTRASFVWATLWDIACSICENYKTLNSVSAHEQDYIWACGGGVQSHTLRQFIAALLNKRVIIRNSYRQSSVVGGVLICNKALGKAQPPAVILEVVEPAERAHYKLLYNEWKRTRSSFKEILS
ncbi:FGGY family carbohydrate kinase [Mucilaginibacter sabulilitoris]|uniref:FGGY family carbohydrate kinase n=1 Tax=Mucilaginibacter sabulilitoris TaxID=1173583 RepID=A0ABZ0TNI2_9SPHI|nr:FGGY family carbohydrate kinase [Mucilaginibacter sabulilitoris]WPU92725.1 FGGY family carbohydrate kinase [Mucilaginibacter sabulilitoris]